MNYSSIMIRFGELSTKGKNKNQFIKQLAKNIRLALSDFDSLTYESRYDHIYIHLNGTDPNEITAIIKEIPGIHAFSLVYKIESDIEKIKATSLEIMNERSGQTFKVTCKRSNKNFELNSEQIVRLVAPVILKNTSFKVDVHNPDVKLSIEVRDEGTYLFTETIMGAGGYPLGSGGKALMMLSGGIDSPVAAYYLLRRGITIECIHFASPPYTSEAVIDKLKDILEKLNNYQETIKLNIVRFTDIQTKIYDVADESYAITIMRRMMYRIADRIAKKHHCLCIANGESIGQVASQTLESMGVIGVVSDLPIIRPLAVSDKLDIIKTAKKLGTFDISIRPFEDCCTIFTPKNPKTKPHISEVLEFESKADFNALIDEAVNSVETIYLTKEE